MKQVRFRRRTYGQEKSGSLKRQPDRSSIRDLVASFDIEKAINPLMVEGQIEGGVMMGLGYAIMEEVVLKEGVIQNLNLQDYIIPTALGMPEIKPIIIEYPNVHGPFGAKGIGEMPNIPAAPAITNAIANAIGGRIYDLPAHSERVFTAIAKRYESGKYGIGEINLLAGAPPNPQNNRL